MKTYRVTGRSADVHAGLVALSAEQARRRQHLLKPRGDGVYEVVQSVQFKQGEQFGYDGEFPKAMADVIADPEAEAKAKAEAEAKAKAEAEASPESAGHDTTDADGTLDLAPSPATASAAKGASEKKGAGKK